MVKNVLGSKHAMNGHGTSWKSIAEQADLVVKFGAVPVRNTQVTPGAMGEHTRRGWLHKANAAGVKFCNISPLRDDAAGFLNAELDRAAATKRYRFDAGACALADCRSTARCGLRCALAAWDFNRFRNYLLGPRMESRKVSIGRRLA